MIVYNELESLESDLGIPIRTLYALSNSLCRHYREKSIPKKNGTGSRVLSIPDEALKAVQTAILEKLLVYEPVSVYAKAYKPGVSVIHNAAPHVGRREMVKLDIYRFFDSISYSDVKDRAFPKERYSEKIRILLAMLCYHNDSLPQGAPTSPAISNIIMREFDETVGEWCRLRGVAYTRYCDDMTFSGESLDGKEITEFIASELGKMHLVLNLGKTRMLGSGQRHSVTGVVVNRRMNTNRAYKRRLRQTIYYCTVRGVEDHLSRIGSDESPERFLSSLLGSVNYILSVEPDNREFKDYKRLILLWKKERGIRR
jgi:retron-type reverse transcriptase